MNTTIHDFLGARKQDVHWERILFLFFSLFIADYLFLIVSPSLENSSETGYSIELFDVYPAYVFFRWIISGLFFSFIAFALFRLSSVSWIAIISTGFSYAVLNTVIQQFLMPVFFHSHIMPAENLLEFQTILNWFIAPGLYYIIFLGSIALTLRFNKSLWLVFLVAFVGGAVCNALVREVLLQLTEMKSDDLFSKLFWGILSTVTMGIAALIYSAGWYASGTSGPQFSDKKEVLSKSFHTLSITVLYGVPILISAAIIVLFTLKKWGKDDTTAIFFILAIALLFLFAGMIIVINMIYKMWTVIQDGHARMTPGQAVGLLFVPVFNIYWGYQVYVGFADDFNTYIQRNSINSKPLPKGLFVTAYILMIASTLPFLFVLAPVILILFIIMISKICDAVNVLEPKN